MNWVIDTDMGLDDQISLLYLAKILQQPNNTFKIKAILTQGNGLAHALPAKNNAVRLLRYAGISIEDLPPVGIGSQDPLEGFNQYPPQWRYEEDDLRGAQIPAYSEETQAQNQSSTRLLKDILTNATERISILSLGTFTTLAQVLSESPKLATKIEKIVCMAGAVNTGGNLHGALNKVSEFNAWIDPVATKIVLESGIPITMVPLDATNKAPLTRTFLDTFRNNTKGPLADLITHWWEGTLKNPVGEYFHWDPLATAIAVSSDIITQIKPVRISVDASPRTWLQPFSQPFGDIKNVSTLNWRGQPRQQLNPYTAGWTKPTLGRSGRPVNVVFDANIPKFEAAMINAFADPSGPMQPNPTLPNIPVSNPSPFTTPTTQGFAVLA